MEQELEFSPEELEIIELPEREALGKGGHNNQHVNQHGGGLLGNIAILIGL